MSEQRKTEELTQQQKNHLAKMAVAGPPKPQPRRLPRLSTKRLLRYVGITPFHN